MKRIVVVGAGAIGLACAHALAKRGLQVVVVDKGAPGDACTKGNAGWIVPSLSAPIPAPGMTWRSLAWMLSSDSPLHVAPTAVPRLARWLWHFWRHCNARDWSAGLHAVAALNRGTLAAFDALAREGIEVELHRQGLLCVFGQVRDMERVRAEFEQLRDYGYRVPTPLSGDALRELEPALSSNVTTGFLTSEEYHVRPESLAAGYAARLTHMGVELRTGVTVLGARAGAHAVVLETDVGAIEGEGVLVAAGAWSGEVLQRFGVRLPVQAGKGYSLTIDTPHPQLQRPVYLGETKIAATPFDGAVRFAGTMELSGVNERFDARRMTAIRKGIARYLREPLPAGGTEWVGMRPLTPDGLPMMGLVPGFGNVWVATGHAMLGITLAPVTGEAMAALIAGEVPPVSLRAFDPGRFRHYT
ncbi:MAG: FAD-dependent oxidoreductase [Gemmatimonadaceae bacterium]|nr:FAD-dependent oxidoreductase [Gemmatimonadaceae bacterium]